MAAAEHGPAPGQHAVAKEALDAARRRLERPVPADADWTACPAAREELVVAADGSIGACEYGACALPTAGAAGDPLARWHEGGRELRADLAAARLPLPHCGGCALWLTHDLYAHLPVLRRDLTAASPAAPHPRRLVLHLPPEPAAWPDALVDRVLALVAEVEVVVLAADRLFAHALLAPVLAAARAAATPPRLQLRCAEIGPVEAAAASCAGLPVAGLELLASSREPDAAAAKALAAQLACPVVVRFVLTPSHWFDFEDAARAAAAAGVPIELHLLDRGGRVPLLALDVDELAVVKDALVSAWPRCGGPDRPPSIAEHAFGHLCAEVRALLRERGERALAAPGSAAPAPDFALPALDHPWCTDPARAAWWLTLLFGHGHLPAVAAWATTTALAPDGRAAVAATPWLRALVQRVAVDQRQPALCSLLREVYAEKKRRAATIAADEAFAAGFDLRPFGGPWAPRLGLAAAPPRKRPFPLGKPKRPAAGAPPPDVTVLVPSYRHEAYIEETLRSVLAQRYPNFRLLVVDDRSPDDTVARARTVDDPRLEVVVNEQNLGLGNSVLAALARIDTPYVALLNSDDLFHPDRLARCREVLERDPHIQLVTTGLALVDQDGGELTPDNASRLLDGQQVFDWVHWYAGACPAGEPSGEQLFAALLERNFLATSSNLVARTDWLRAQAESLRSLKYCLDWQLFLEAALAGALHHLPEPLAAYRLHATNTVWFRDGRRWSYYLEVNRVVASALRRYAERRDLRREDDAVPVLDAISRHATENRETDGFALFLHAVFDALQLDRLAHSSPRVQELVAQLNTTAERIRAARDLAEHPPARHDASRAIRDVLGELASEQLRVERNDRRWLQGYADSLEARVRDCWSGRHRLEDEKTALLHRQAELDRRVADLGADVQRLDGALQAERARAGGLDGRVRELQHDLDGARADLQVARGAAAAIADLRDLVGRELAAVRAERDMLQQERARTEAVLAGERAEAARLRDAHARLQADLDRAEAAGAQLASDKDALTLARDTLARERDSLAKERDTLSRQHQETTQALGRESAQVRALAQAKKELEQSRNQLVHDLARTREEMDKLVRSREYRSGNFLWNKMPLAYLSRRGKKWYRRLVDAKNRCLMLIRRRRHAEGVAVVAACWQWPIYSHTFVYQEMIGLTHMGLDVRMFHWDLGDTTQLHRAFAYLADHRTQLQPIWENHLRDKEHFEKTRPGRLRAFLELVAARTGRKVEDLEKEALVLQGCTFARMAELAGARYLHSYFFYDQSFMVMQAAWLLGIPRGVSAYADHMLDDYPFKLVGLHVELADVVVATSARIKRELSAKSGGKFDDKIVVKPNGVDGARFPALQRPERKPDEPFEMVSISRIEPKKGLTWLAEAVAELKRRGHKVVVHVIGSKDQHSKGSLEYAADFERRIAELGVGQEMVLHGMKRQEELPPILQRSRAFVAPYVEVENGDKDGIPTAMLEGLASGLPVVTTDSGSILEVVTDGVEGLVVPQRDSKALADAVERLIRDPSLERRLAKAARARFDREFDIRVTERRLHERVAALIAARTGGR